MIKPLLGRVPNVAVGVIVGLIAGGGVFAWAQTAKSDDAGVHGGPKARFHDASACNLVDVGALEGNWTHGDYVKAVASADPSKVSDAARSRCGKPVKGGPGADKATKSQKDKARATPKPSKSPQPKPTAAATTAAPSVSPTTSSPEPSPATGSPSPETSPT